MFHASAAKLENHVTEKAKPIRKRFVTNQLYTTEAQSFARCPISSKRRFTALTFPTFVVSAVLLSGGSASADTLTSAAGGIENYTVLTSGNYMITAMGASGGNEHHDVLEDSLGGRAAIEVGEFTLIAGTNLFITVGGMGGNGTASFGNVGGGGGGGATMVSQQNVATPLLVAVWRWRRRFST